MAAGAPSLKAGAPSTAVGVPSTEAGVPSMEAGAPSLEAGAPSLVARTPSLAAGACCSLLMHSFMLSFTLRRVRPLVSSLTVPMCGHMNTVLTVAFPPVFIN